MQLQRVADHRNFGAAAADALAQEPLPFARIVSGGKFTGRQRYELVKLSLCERSKLAAHLEGLFARAASCLALARARTCSIAEDTILGHLADGRNVVGKIIVLPNPEALRVNVGILRSSATL